MANTSELFKYMEAMAKATGNTRGGGGEDNTTNALLRRLLAGHETPSRSNAEALGKGFRKFGIPLLTDAFNTWKSRYDARGDWNARKKSIMEQVNAKQKLSPADQQLYDYMQKNYPDTIQQTQNPPTTPQAPTTPQFINDGVGAPIKNSLFGRVDGIAPSQIAGDAPFPAQLTGEALANAAQAGVADATKNFMEELTRKEELERLLGNGRGLFG